MIICNLIKKLMSDQSVSYFANISTIIALILGLVAYFRWKKEYRLQQSHVYALDLLKKIKTLHYSIEQLRAPKFYHPEKLVEDIEKHYIPKIEEKIFAKVIEIQSDLIMAKNTLLKNKNIQETFNKEVFDKVIKKINHDIILFKMHKRKNKFDVKKSDVFASIFPLEVTGDSENKFKKSILETGQDIINDDLNKIIEESFKLIYSMLEDNLI